MKILAFALVDNERRYQLDGSAVLMRFDCEVDGVEIDRVALVRTTSGLVIRPPRHGAIPPAAKAALTRLAAGCFVAAGGVEDMPLDVVA